MKLPYEMTLEGIGFKWIINIKEIGNYDLIIGNMTLETYINTKNSIVNKQSFCCPKNDLLEMVNYLDEHIKHLSINPDNDSYTFTKELEFTVKAYCGDIYDNMDGDFGIKIMISIGKTKDETRVYSGIEGSLYITKCKEFMKKILDFVNYDGEFTKQS